MPEPVRTEIAEGIHLTVVPTDKFKTTTICFCFHRDLDDDYSYNALIPAVLKRGCEGLPTVQKINAYLEKMYGAILDVGVQKKGERQLLKFTLSVVDDGYIPTEEAILAQGFHFLSRLLTKPAMEKELFNEDYVKQECDQMISRIEGLLNDKEEYATERCIQAMYHGEKFSKYVFGSVDDLKKLDTKRLARVYKEMLENSPLDIIVVGNVKPAIIKEYIDNSYSLERGKIKKLSVSPVKKISIKKDIVKEHMNIAQGKLVIGCRTNTLYMEVGYFPLMVYSSILGGGPYAKLFNNIREEQKLAYYIYTSLEKFHGLMIVSAGIEKDSLDSSLDGIYRDIDAMKHGEITEMELMAAKKDILTSTRAIEDDPQQLINYYLEQSILDKIISLAKYEDKIDSVGIEDVVKVAKKIKIDTLYFLSSDGKKVQ